MKTTVFQKRDILSFLLAALMIAAIPTTIAGIPALAQVNGVTIMTSADKQGGKFFGEGVLQVVISDDDTDDEAEDEITVDVEAESDIGVGDIDTFEITDTRDGSQEFEFFISHVDSQWADGSGPTNDIDPINTSGIIDTDPSSAEVGGGAGMITFGDGGLLDTNTALYEDVTITITYRDEEITIDYDESTAEFILASNGSIANVREWYGGNSLVYMVILDQDANLNPTEPDRFAVTEDDLNTDLFSINGGDFADDVTFWETGYNTALFEGIVELGDDDATDPESDFVQTSESVIMTLRDQAAYDETNLDVTIGTTVDPNTSTDTSEVFFWIQNEDGALEEIGDLTLSSELKLMVNDPDQNRDGGDAETLDNVITIAIDATGGDEENIDMEETDDNTGIFTIDATNGELKLNFLADDADVPAPDNGILEFRPSDLDEDIIIVYNDSLDDSEDEVGAQDPDLVSVVTVITSLSLTTGTIELPQSAGIEDDFTLTINDPDLNDNPRVKDSYSFTLDGTGPEFGLMRGGQSIGSLATIEVEVKGESPVFDRSLTYTLTETGANTGIFSAKIEMQDILQSTGIQVDNGDTLEITYNDKQDVITRANSDRLSIGGVISNVDFSRTTLPIPPGTDLTGDTSELFSTTTVSTTLMVIDSEQNEQNNTEDSIDFVLGTGDGEFTIEIRGAEGSDVTDITYDGVTPITDPFVGAGAAGISLDDILPDIVGGITLTETGKATGVFDETLDFDQGGLSAENWHNLEIIFTYTDLNGEEESQGITFRGNDGFVTVNKNVVKSGDILTVTVQDEDLNIEDGEIEEFDSETAGADPFLVIVETEDNEIPDLPTIETFRETGPNTGIFTASWLVGKDLAVVSNDGMDHATSIHITYNDEVESTGNSGKELTLNVKINPGSTEEEITVEIEDFVYDQGDEVVIEGTVDGADDGEEVEITIEGPDGSDSTEDAEIDDEEYSFTYEIDNNAREGLYIVQVSFGSDDVYSYFKVVEDEDDDPITVETDDDLYSAGDTVEISGFVQDPELGEDEIDIEVIGPNNKRVYDNTVDLDGDEFSDDDFDLDDDADPGRYAVIVSYAGHEAVAIFEVEGEGSGNGGQITVKTDKATYEAGDIVEMAGKVDVVSGEDKVSIEVIGPDNKDIVDDEVDVENDGSFSFGFELENNAVEGEYRIIVTYNNDDVEIFFEVEGSNGQPFTLTIEGNMVPMIDDKKIPKQGKLVVTGEFECDDDKLVAINNSLHGTIVLTDENGRTEYGLSNIAMENNEDTIFVSSAEMSSISRFRGDPLTCDILGGIELSNDTNRIIAWLDNTAYVLVLPSEGSIVVDKDSEEGGKVALALDPPVKTSPDESILMTARFFDEKTNENFKEVTYRIFFKKGGYEIPLQAANGEYGGQGFFYDPEGNLVLKIVPQNTDYAVVQGEPEIQYGGIWNRGEPIVVEGPIFTEPGPYDILVEIHTVGTTRTQLDPILKYEFQVSPLGE